MGVTIVSLENADMALSVAPESGGELSSLRLRRVGDWMELLHRANDFAKPASGWRGRAPWLFPAVGRSFLKKFGEYALGGRIYPMPLHGFVMERAWELVKADATAIVCRTSADERTRRLYPFGFELSVAYSLSGRGLSARATVAAAADNDGPMPFSIGNHLTFAVDDAARCVVRAPARNSLILTPEGLLSGQRTPADYSKGRRLKENPELRDMVLGDFPSNSAWVEVGLPSGVVARVSQREIPSDRARMSPNHHRFVFYSDGRSFLCAEPWCGGPNSLNTGEGLIVIEPGKRFEWEMEIALL